MKNNENFCFLAKLIEKLEERMPFEEAFSLLIKFWQKILETSPPMPIFVQDCKRFQLTGLVLYMVTFRFCENQFLPDNVPRR